MSYQPFPPNSGMPGYSQAQQDPHMAGYPQAQHDPRMTGYPQQFDPRMQGYAQPPAQAAADGYTEIVRDDNQGRINSLYWSINVIKFLFGLLEVILGLRFVLRLLAANSYSPFVAILYGVSYPFVALFQGIFRDPSFSNGSVIEATTLIAMIVYALVAWGAIALAKIVLAPSLSGSRRITTTRSNHYS